MEILHSAMHSIDPLSFGHSIPAPSLPSNKFKFFLEECVTRLRDHYLDHLSGSGALSSLGCGVSSYTVQQFNNAQIK